MNSDTVHWSHSTEGPGLPVTRMTPISPYQSLLRQQELCVLIPPTTSIAATGTFHTCVALGMLTTLSRHSMRYNILQSHN